VNVIASHPAVIIAAAVVVVALIVAVGVMANRRRRLRNSFGAVYDDMVGAKGSRKAEAELAAHKTRFDRAHIRALSAADRERYLELWKGIQARFVDSPMAAVGEAEFLVSEVMRLRGYPAADHEQRLADVALAHPHLLDHYREACDVAARSRKGDANTEDQRRAFVHYRALMDDLLDVGVSEPVAVRR
jgi:hypothetical protein